MPKQPKVLSIIVCEDIREEVGGKQSAYGLFDFEMICANFPALLPKLYFRVLVQIPRRKPKTLKFLVSHGTHKLIEYDGAFPEIAMPTTSGNVAMGFAASPAIIPAAADYTIKMGIDAPLKTVAHFNFRLPKGDVERARLPS
jgi:hypothetical protein